MQIVAFGHHDPVRGRTVVFLHFIVGMTKSAPARMPVGHCVVIVSIL